VQVNPISKIIVFKSYKGKALHFALDINKALNQDLIASKKNDLKTIVIVHYAENDDVEIGYTNFLTGKLIAKQTLPHHSYQYKYRNRRTGSITIRDGTYSASFDIIVNEIKQHIHISPQGVGNNNLKSENSPANVELNLADTTVVKVPVENIEHNDESLKLKESEGNGSFSDNSQNPKESLSPTSPDEVLAHIGSDIQRPIEKMQTGPNIGDRKDGGIVCWVEQDGAHGLIMDFTDLNKSNWEKAVQMANRKGPGWHLPNQEELNKLYMNKYILGGFESSFYWSSNEYYSDEAWVQNFYSGFQAHASRANIYPARIVRSF
jgi:hypothetical protein